MSIWTRILRDPAVYWQASGVDNFGQPLFLAPVPLLVRWENRTVLYVNQEGQQVAGRAKLFLPQAVFVNDVFMQGTLADVGPDPNPFSNAGAYRVMSVQDLKNIKATKQYDFAIL